MALEYHIESRLISVSSSNTEEEFENKASQACSKQQRWQIETGPFEEQRLTNLSNSDWTLLVQAVDQYIPAVAELREYFAFIPAWQIDDVMVSYATRGGGVGPHFDRYDVFLVQGEGQRQWKIGQRCDQHTALQADQSLHLLQDFEESECFTLSAGDILYLPPYLAHWGTSLDNDCMTYSVGFRSPSESELIDDFTATLQSRLSEDDRFQDSIPYVADTAQRSGEIDSSTIDNIKRLLMEKISAQLNDKEQLSRWFGVWASEPKYALIDPLSSNEEGFSADEIIDMICSDSADSEFICRDDASRFYYIEQDNKLLLFVNGREINLDINSKSLAESAKAICNNRTFSADTLIPWLKDNNSSQILLELFNRQELFLQK